MDKRKRSFRIVLIAALILALCIGLSACSGKKDEDPKIEGFAIQHEPEFGGVYIEITIDDFNQLGFVYGDSVKVVFSNGYTLEDVPYYNGYYVDAGQPLLIAYPGYEYIKALAKNFYGISETKAYRAMNLDVNMIAAEDVLEKAEISVVE